YFTCYALCAHLPPFPTRRSSDLTKFVFRSLIREHSEPAEFLRHANEVVCGEVASGKFVTMLCLTIDAGAGEVACACAGHPAPRIDRKSTRLNSSHQIISYAVFCL